MINIRITEHGTLEIASPVEDATVHLTTADALELFERLSGLLPTLPAPELLRGQDAEGNDAALVCPHQGCGGTHLYDQAESTLVEVDADVRHNDAYVTEDGDVHVEQGDSEYTTMLFLCGYCLKPVDLGDAEVTWG